MVRTLFVALLLLAAARLAAADEAETGTPAVAANAPAATQPIDAANQKAKRHPVDTKAAGARAEPPAAASDTVPPGGDVKMSGMSILGNEDAPKSLVIVPWKSSQLADMPSVSRLLDSATQPVDKDVFMRELSYYEFKSGSK